MYDKFNRKINYLRVSVTDRCNLRCVYCMPADGVQLMAHDDILSFNEITEVVSEAVAMGVDKIRITGGEPLVRRGIIDLVKMIGRIKGIKDFGMTTNGIFLEKYAQQLADAGLHRINVSLDTMDSSKYKMITRVGDLNSVLKGIEAAKRAGLEPIKINCVIKKTSNEPDAQDVARFCAENNLKIRFIREMDLEKGTFWKVNGGDGGDCKICNRLRLTSDGKIKPCLFSDIEYSVREYGTKQALDKALGNKPISGTISVKNKFSNIGG